MNLNMHWFILVLDRSIGFSSYNFENEERIWDQYFQYYCFFPLKLRHIINIKRRTTLSMRMLHFSTNICLTIIYLF